MKTYCLVLAILLNAFFVQSSVSAPYAGVVSSIIDGDTIVVDGKKIRLYGIDAPESTQMFGEKAKTLLTMLIYGEHVEIFPYEKDQYGRTVAVVKFQDKIINESLIKNGAAWLYSEFCREKFCVNWKNLMLSAQKQHKGLWQQASPTPPWQWRRRATVITKETDNQGKNGIHATTNSIIMVDRILDGDTFSIINELGKSDIVNLYGVDAPELNQPYGVTSKDKLSKLISGKPLLIDPVTDNKSSVNSTQKVSNANIYADGVNINAKMIASGNAWVNDEICKNNICNYWREYQTEASKNKIGLWKQENPIKPWIWRKAYARVRKTYYKWHEISESIDSSSYRYCPSSSYTFPSAYGTNVSGKVHVRGYTRKDGTYVRPHYRSAPSK